MSTASTFEIEWNLGLTAMWGTQLGLRHGCVANLESLVLQINLDNQLERKIVTKQHGGAIVDLGNVIIAHWLNKTTSENFHRIDYNSIPEAPEAFHSLSHLNEKFGGNVTVVYNATDTATEKIIGWLGHRLFTKRTGIPFDRVLRTVNGRDKSPYVDQSSLTHYGTTVVIDDRLEVLSHFVGRVPHLFLFRPQVLEVARYLNTGAWPHIRVVKTWKEIMTVLNK